MVQDVIKIGGSLLAEPGTMRRVADWLAATRRRGATRLLIAGGGPVVEGLREIDAANGLPVEASHWAAVRLMDSNTRLLAEWAPGIEEIDSIQPLLPGDKAFVCQAWLHEEEPSQPGVGLATGWRTTSDSIAARLAEVTGARLTLLKHSISGTYDTPEAAADAGVVDAELPRHAAGLAGFRLVGVIRPGL